MVKTGRKKSISRNRRSILTRHRQVEKKIEELSEMKSVFISTVSHELRTPLAAVKEAVMLVFDGTTGKITSQQKRFLSIAMRNIERLAKLINDLLDISKIEKEELCLVKQNCDVNDLIKKAIEPFSILIKYNNFTLNKYVDADLPKILCDPDRIIQVITNLLGNAIKFTPKSGTITFTCTKLKTNGSGSFSIADKKQSTNKNFIKVSIEDTGIGIEKKYISQLFSRFSQLGDPLTRRPGGTGLGLSICKDLVEMHSGKIWIESKPGKGSIFSFALPVD